MEKIAEYLSPETAKEYFKQLADDIGADEVAVVKNIDCIYAPRELYLMTPKKHGPFKRISAFVVDMDGTSTTTEPLALHSLEYMVRRFTGKVSTEQWLGLDAENDYPYVIGNSNFRHTEFLLNRYRDWLDWDSLKRAFIESLLWTLGSMNDPHRIRDIKQNAVNCGLTNLLENDDFIQSSKTKLSEQALEEKTAELTRKFGAYFNASSESALTGAALDIYYYRYHSILQQVEQGKGAELSHELLGEHGRRLVEPMPGYGIFVALIKGWLGGETAKVYPFLKREINKAGFDIQISDDDAVRKLTALGEHFSANPSKLALVTASIAFETHVTLQEIFRVIVEQTDEWGLSSKLTASLKHKMSDYRDVYDGVACATDAWEARLKPHRDLYSIALYQMALPKSEYPFVVGIEDTEPGIISLRTAGIGCAVALPNHDTKRQNYHAAAHIVKHGLPELILKHNLLIAE